MKTTIRPGKRVYQVRYEVNYDNLDVPGACFWFPCDPQGNIEESQLQPEHLETLRKCQNGTYNVGPARIEKVEWSYWEPAAIRCNCGRLVELSDPMTNTCKCGLLWNGCGQELAPRSQWFDECYCGDLY